MPPVETRLEHLPSPRVQHRMWPVVLALALSQPVELMNADRFTELMAALPVASIEQGDVEIMSGQAFCVMMNSIIERPLTQAQFDLLVYQSLLVVEHPDTPTASQVWLLFELWDRRRVDGLAVRSENLEYDAPTSLRQLADRDPSIARRLAPLLEHEVYVTRTAALRALGACGEAASNHWPAMLDADLHRCCGFHEDPSLETAFRLCGPSSVPFLFEMSERGNTRAAAVLASMAESNLDR